MRRAVEQLHSFTLRIGGYFFWVGLILYSLWVGFIKGCSAVCYYEVVKEVGSPNGQQVAQIYMKDCGGATTRGWGGVNVLSPDRNLVAENIITFDGHYTDVGLIVEWMSDTELSIKVSSLQNVRYINPHGNESGNLSVIYQYYN